MLNLNKYLSDALLLWVDTSKIFPLYAEPPKHSRKTQRKNLKKRIQDIEASFTHETVHRVEYISATQEELAHLTHYADSFLHRNGHQSTEHVHWSQQRARALWSYLLKHDKARNNRTDFIKWVYHLADHYGLTSTERAIFCDAIKEKRTLIYQSCFENTDYQHFTLEELVALEEELNMRYSHCTNDPQGYIHDRYVLMRKIMQYGTPISDTHHKIFWSDTVVHLENTQTKQHTGKQLTLKTMYPHFPDSEYIQSKKNQGVSYREALSQILKPHNQSYERSIIIKIFNKYNYYHRIISPLPPAQQKQAEEHYRALLLSKKNMIHYPPQADLFSQQQLFSPRLIEFLSIRIKFDHP